MHGFKGKTIQANPQPSIPPQSSSSTGFWQEIVCHEEKIGDAKDKGRKNFDDMLEDAVHLQPCYEPTDSISKIN